MRRRRPLLSPALFLLLLLSACDSGPTIEGEDLAGTYDFEDFFFDIAAPAVEDVSFLDTLAAADTQLELSADNEFVLVYRFEGAPSRRFLTGPFEVDGNQVILSFRRSDDDKRRQLLLPRELALRIQENGALLVGTRELEDVDLSQFSEAYQGLTGDGTLRLRLRSTAAP